MTGGPASCGGGDHPAEQDTAVPEAGREAADVPAQGPRREAGVLQGEPSPPTPVLASLHDARSVLVQL